MIDHLALRAACDMLNATQFGNKMFTGTHPMWNENIFTTMIQYMYPGVNPAEIQKTWFFLVNIKVLTISTKYNYYLVDELNLYTTIQTITRFSTN